MTVIKGTSTPGGPDYVLRYVPKMELTCVLG